MRNLNADTDGSFVHLGGMLVNIDHSSEVGSGGGAVLAQTTAFLDATLQPSQGNQVQRCLPNFAH